MCGQEQDAPGAEEQLALGMPTHAPELSAATTSPEGSEGFDVAKGDRGSGTGLLQADASPAVLASSDSAAAAKKEAISFDSDLATLAPAMAIDVDSINFGNAREKPADGPRPFQHQPSHGHRRRQP